MLQALLAGVASIQAQQSQMNVIGNNLANVNTTAFKNTQMTFQDMMSQTLRGAGAPTGNVGGTDPIQIGLGVSIGATNTDEGQGSLDSTGQPTDMAIQGNGYFVVSNGSGNYYTRDGSFTLDSEGNLVQSSTGNPVLGWLADSNGNIDASKPITPTSNLKVPLGSLNAVQKTSNIDYAGNLNASAASTDTWTTQVSIYDSLGTQHVVTLEFSNPTSPPPAAPPPPAGATSSWQWTAYDGPSTSGTAIGSSSTAGNSLLYFDGNGAPVNSLPAGSLNTITEPASGGAPAFPVTLNFAQLSQLSASSSVSAKDQNGFPPGSLQGFSVSQDGVISGLFTNGLTRNLGQVAMANFPNPGGLSNLGGNLFQSTNNSGIPIIGQPNSSGLGTVNSGFLEQSNVDISSEFTHLIVTQQGFQANTKIVTTVNQMFTDVINMIQ